MNKNTLSTKLLSKAGKEVNVEGGQSNNPADRQGGLSFFTVFLSIHNLKLAAIAAISAMQYVQCTYVNTVFTLPQDNETVQNDTFFISMCSTVGIELALSLVYYNPNKFGKNCNF